MACAVGWECGAGALAREIQRSLPASPDSRGRLSPPDLFTLFAERFDLYIHSRGQIQLHQRVHRLLRRLENIEEALVGADFELLARFLVDVRRTQYRVFVFHRGQRNRTRDLRPGAFGRVHNFSGRLIENAIVVSFQPDANSLFSYHYFISLTPPGVSGRKELAASCKPLCIPLLHNLCNRSCADRVPAFANREPQTFFHSNRRDQFDHQADIVAGHHHLGAARQLRYSRHVRRSQIKLRAVSFEEWRVPSTLFFGEDIHLSFEFGVRSNGPRLCQHHAALDILFRDAAQQQAGVVARHAFVELLLEHLDARHDRLARVAEADNLYFLSDLYFSALDSPRDYRAAPLNREDVFDRHQERLIQFALRLRHTLVDRIHQGINLRFPLGLAIQSTQRRQTNHRHIVAGKLVRLQQLSNFELNQIQQLGIIHRVTFIQRDDDVRHAHLASQQNVLARLRHGAVGRGHN